MSSQPKGPSRREFLHSGAAAVLGAAAVPYAGAATFHPGGTETLKVGLVGCGGRGTGAAAQALRADPNTRLVAMADAFEDQLQRSLANLQKSGDLADRVQVDPSHQFVGFDGYKGVIESCDVVLLASSPHFRARHMKAAVEAGRHLFVEKPVATDAPGVRSVWESSQKAKEKGLNVVSGLCYRYQKAKRETIQRVYDGAIGDITALQCTYNTGELWHRGHKPDWSDMEWQLRNWLYFTWLSGDHITEQHIHSLDKLAWAMGDKYPVKCVASGGRIKRTDPEFGNIYDHFNTTYEWEGGIRGFSSCRQWSGTKHDVSDHLFGTQGVARLQAHQILSDTKWRWKSSEPDDMYQNEHNALFAAIRSGQPINNGEYMCKSTLMAIMGRMAAYTGQEITWDRAWNSEEDLSPPAYEWGELEVTPVAIPGIKKFL